jgi:8-oxo-dGTP diphosphatase
MNIADQGAARDRHHVVPRTLVFLTSINPATDAREVLLLQGAAGKRLWAGRYNGLGGHVEANEDVLAAAQRELLEEAGQHANALTMRGVVHVQTAPGAPGVMLFVFYGEAESRDVVATIEGAPVWLPLNALDGLPLVDDLPMLLARALGSGPLFFAHYAPQPDGTLCYRFND